MLTQERIILIIPKSDWRLASLDLGTALAPRFREEESAITESVVLEFSPRVVLATAPVVSTPSMLFVMFENAEDPGTQRRYITLPLSQNLSVHFDDSVLGRVRSVDGDVNNAALSEWQVAEPLLGTSLLQWCRDLVSNGEAATVVHEHEVTPRTIAAREELHLLARQMRLQRLPSQESRAERTRLFLEHQDLMDAVAAWAARMSEHRTDEE